LANRTGAVQGGECAAVRALQARANAATRRFRHEVPRIVLIDDAGIHKDTPIDKKRRQWAKHGMYLHYLPPYSPELNRIEILWKHAKHFWRRFVAKNGADLLDEVQSLMSGFGDRFTINFA
jgi:transposase